jgi:hypothetical protein
VKRLKELEHENGRPTTALRTVERSRADCCTDRSGRRERSSFNGPRWLVSNGVRLREDRQAEGH